MIPDSVTSLFSTSVYSLYWGEDDDSWQCDEERGEHGKTDEACLVEVAATEKDSW